MKKTLLIWLCTVVVGWLTHSAVAQSLASTNRLAATTAYRTDAPLQQEESQRPLADVLEGLQNQHQVLFNYEPDIVKGKKVEKLISEAEQADVEAVLEHYLSPLRLDYKKLKEGYYVIFSSNQPNVDKVKQQSVSGSLFNRTTLPARASLRSSDPLSAQRSVVVAVSGTVTDLENNEPIPGVNVVVKDSEVGTVTDVEGSFRLDVPSEESVLVFSSIGYLSEEVTVGSQTIIDVALAPSLEQLSEIVVIGYGEREQKDLTGAISQIGSEAIENTISINPQASLQGRAAGVFVSSPGGDPNQRPQVRIRGLGTLGNNEPLYVVDGVPVTEFGSGTSYTISSDAVDDVRGSQNVLNLINPADIESISILKDASSAAIYGVRAANGVVLITTKRGRKDTTPQVTLNASRGIQNVPNTFDVLGVDQYTQLYQDAYANNSNRSDLPIVFSPDTSAFLGNLPFVDWQDELLNKNAIVEDYNLGVSGGNEVSNYYVSAGYSRQESILQGVDNERYSFSINSDHAVNDWFKVGESFRFSYLDAKDNRGGNLIDAASTPPWQPILGDGPGGYAPIRQSFRSNDDDFIYGPAANSNIFGAAAFRNNDYSILRNLGSVYAAVEPLEGLTFKGTLSADWYYNRRNSWEDGRVLAYAVNGRNNNYRERHSRNYNLVGEFAVNFNRNFGDHNIDILLNAMNQRYGWEQTNVSVVGLSSTDPDLRIISEDLEGREGVTRREEYALQGYLARLGYNYQSKYYLDATVRRDGTSRFIDGLQWGTFPAVSAAWRISAEPFMENSTFIDDLKIRGGWGQAGNQETRAYSYLALANLNPRYTLGTGNPNPEQGTIALGATINGDLPIEDLSWETVTTLNVGIDALLLNDRLAVTIDLYQRTTEDILQAVELPLTAGIRRDAVFNLAEVENRGIEVALGYNGTVGDLQYNVTGNLTTVRNRVTQLFEGAAFGDNENRIEEGYPIEYYYGYQTDGIFQDQAAVDAYLANTSDPGNDVQKAPGDIIFVDRFGAPTELGQFRSNSPDGTVNQFDQVYLGKKIPGFFYGLGLNLNYRAFDLALQFRGVGDVQRLNAVRRALEGMQGEGANQLVSTLDRWTETNTDTDIPRAIAGDPSGNTRFSGRWIENADFFRLNNAQLGYSLPTSLLESLNIDRARVYISTANLFTITGYSGLDPENDQVPVPRIFSVGASVTF